MTARDTSTATYNPLLDDWRLVPCEIAVANLQKLGRSGARVFRETPAEALGPDSPCLAMLWSARGLGWHGADYNQAPLGVRGV